jgi:hypothetical protein
MQTPILRRPAPPNHRHWGRSARGLILLVWSAPVWGAAAIGGLDTSVDGLSNWPVQIDYRPPALGLMAFLPEPHFALPPRLAAPGIEAPYRLVNRIQEHLTGLAGFRLRCPGAAGGCMPWLGVSLSLVSEGDGSTCRCRPSDAGFEGQIEIALEGEILLFDPRIEKRPEWPFRGYDRRVRDPCTARAHEYGYHVEWALGDAIHALTGFLVQRHDSEFACERGFHRARIQAVQAFERALESSKQRETLLRTVGQYDSRSRFGLSWGDCS